jgi:hypothetical protein
VQELGAAGLAWKVVLETSVNFSDGFEPMPDVIFRDLHVR